MAGNESGQQSGFIGKGSTPEDAMWSLDGVVITDMAAIGASPTLLRLRLLRRGYASPPAATTSRSATGGIGINLVTKRGTNDFHGGVRGFFTHHKLESSNMPDELEGDPRLFQNGGDGQGRPHRPDRRLRRRPRRPDRQGQALVLGRLRQAGHPHPQLQRQTPDKTLLKDYNAKVNWQATGNDMVSVFYFLGAKKKFGRAGSAAHFGCRGRRATAGTRRAPTTASSTA